MLCISGKINLINTGCGRDHNPHVGDQNPLSQSPVPCLRDWYCLSLMNTA